MQRARFFARGVSVLGSLAVPSAAVTRTVSELLRSGEPTFSFEFFPPEDGGRASDCCGRRSVSWSHSNPSFVSITYGAGGCTRDVTAGVIEHIATDTSLPPMGHLTSVTHRSPSFGT